MLNAGKGENKNRRYSCESSTRKKVNEKRKRISEYMTKSHFTVLHNMKSLEDFTSDFCRPLLAKVGNAKHSQQNKLSETTSKMP